MRQMASQEEEEEEKEAKEEEEEKQWSMKKPNKKTDLGGQNFQRNAVCKNQNQSNIFEVFEVFEVWANLLVFDDAK